MAHTEQLNFVRGVKRRFPELFEGMAVLEIGSRNINGTVRDFFNGCSFLGIDAAEGPGVDRVALAHEFDPAAVPGCPALFDVIVCCEVLEHDPHCEQSLKRMAWLLEETGLLIVTAAGPQRREHGTTRTTIDGKVYGPAPDFYENRTVDDIVRPLMAVRKWRFITAEFARGCQDVYVVAITENEPPLAH